MIAISIFSMIKGIKIEEIRKRIQAVLEFSSIKNSPNIKRYIYLNEKKNLSIKFISESLYLVRILRIIEKASNPNIRTTEKGLISFITSIINLISPLVEENTLRKDSSLNQAKKLRPA